MDADKINENLASWNCIPVLWDANDERALRHVICSRYHETRMRTILKSFHRGFAPVTAVI